MMPRKKIKHEARDYMQEAVYGSIVLGLGALGLNHYFDLNIDYGVPLALAFGRAALVRWLQEGHRRPNAITAEYNHPARAVRVNGKKVFMQAVSLLGYKEPTAQQRGEFVWRVPYRDQKKPIPIREAKLYSYAVQGWRRQLTGDPAPFSRRKFTKPEWSPKAEWCCKAILASSGCFNHAGQGVSSMLVLMPPRAVAACKRRYNPPPPNFVLRH